MREMLLRRFGHSVKPFFSNLGKKMPPDTPLLPKPFYPFIFTQQKNIIAPLSSRTGLCTSTQEGSMSAPYPTDKGVAARVEELLREQLLELGEDPQALQPHLIMQNMQCEVYPDDSMVYIWKETPILRVVPERTATGVMWRMFTRDEDEPIQ